MEKLTATTTVNAQGNVIFNGTEFYAVGSNRAHKSSDGLSWTTTPFNLTNAVMRQVARDPVTGVYAGLGRDGVSYFVSSDGFQWSQLPTSSAPAGTDLVRIAFGYGSPTATCPL
jgi:hypothetical protein